MKSRRIIYQFCFLAILVSCNKEKDSGLAGNWSFLYSGRYNIKNIIIEDNNVTVIDDYEMYYSGIVDEKRQVLELRIGGNNTLSIDYQLEDSLLVIFDSIKLIRSYPTPSLNLSRNIELLGLDSDVMFPFQDNYNFRNANRKFLSVKLRNAKHIRPLLLGDYEGRLPDLGPYLTLRSCFSTMRARSAPDEIVIFIEKGVLVKDLLILEQYLTLHFNKKTFILVTDYVDFGTYQVIIDRRTIFSNDLLSIDKLMSEYLGVREPSPPNTTENTIENFISLDKGELIRFENIEDYQVAKPYLLKIETELIVKLSKEMPIEEYLYILNSIQGINLINGKSIKVHILD